MNSVQLTEADQAGKVEEEANNSGVEASVENNANSTSTDSLNEQDQFMRLPDSVKYKKSASALRPVFSMGFNRHVPIIDLSTEKRRFVLYSCSHVGIILDYAHNEQMMLQGHCNTITCTTASRDKRWLATGDRGKNSVLIIWDCNTGLPVRTMFEPHPNGVVAIALTPDARYLATLSAESEQTFAIWDWTTGDELPLCSATISHQYGIQTVISFDDENICNVATNSDSQVLFYQWDKAGSIKYYAPLLTDHDFNKPIGKFCGTVFPTRTGRAVSATSLGLLVVWESNLPLVKVSTECIPDKKAVKLVPIHNKAVTVITLIDSFIVTGDAGGDVKFFDFNFKLVFWYQDWKFGPIHSLSPSGADASTKRVKQMMNDSEYPDDATINNTRFIMRDFIVATATTIFATVTVEGSKIKVIFHDHDSSVFAVDAHPTMPMFASGSYSGLLKLFNYETMETVRTKIFEKMSIKAICFDHIGLQIAVGFVNGDLRVLDVFALKDVLSVPLSFSKTAITHIRFNDRSEFLVTIDDNNTISLFRGRQSKTEEAWVYVARYRAHYKRVLEVMFGRNFDTDTPRLLTLGEDRRLVEYDLLSAKEDYLPILQTVRIEQSAIPLSMCWYPVMDGEGFLVMSNDQLKLKLFNHKTKMCRYTFLGPAFGSPINTLRVLPESLDHPMLETSTKKRRYLYYANRDKIGIIRLPLNGNPYNYMTMIAHPRGVTNITSTFDGKFLVSVGEDFIVTVWRIDLDVLEMQVEVGGDGMAPFYQLIDGGEFGPFMHELKDYFYYSMIRNQGIDSLDTRHVDTVIDIKEVPFIMRAIGFYPSEEEIEAMMNELKFMEYYRTGQYTDKIDLNTFLKLYINHRPAFGIDAQSIDGAIRLITKHEGELTAAKFLDLLMSKGETIVDDELAEYLATLLGGHVLGGSLEATDDMDMDKAVAMVTDSLPSVVTAKSFIEDILCMKVVDKEEALPGMTDSSQCAACTQT